MEAEYIRPSADLRNKYSEISKLCKETREPIYITVNGRGDTVLLDMAEYVAMRKELQLLQDLAEAEEDIKNGRVAPAEDMFSNVRQLLSELNNGKIGRAHV